jgi:hypothetical protein
MTVSRALLLKVLPWSATVVVLVAAVAALAAFGSPDVTKPRLERSIAATFSNLYVQQAGILGIGGVSVTSVAASADCDRGGPKVPDVGAGADWVCQVSFVDNTGHPQQGKFELQVRPDSTYVAGGPSKLIGLATITNSAGVDVPNPVFEFDGAFDPNS